LTIREKTISGLSWSLIENISNKGINFIIGIILARLLSPNEFGLVGMITIFIAISQTFITSGLGLALIRKNDCTQKDYSTVFYFNTSLSILFYVLLFLTSRPIAAFFKEPQLTDLLKVLSLSLIFNALSMVQQTILTKEINFQKLTTISIIASVVSGAISIILAYKGFGVWSLVWKTVIYSFVTFIMLWILESWKPVLMFSFNSFREMFRFGYKLLLSTLIYTVYLNIYQLVIGKFFSAMNLGYYTRANQFQQLPSSNLSGIIQKVSLPVLVKFQDDKVKLKDTYKKMVQLTMFLTFSMMIGMAAVANPLIIFLIGEKWLPAVPYLQILCFVGILDPLHSLNLNILFVDGRSDLGLKLEIIKFILAIPFVVIGVLFGIKYMLLGMIVYTIIAYLINSRWSGQIMNYPVIEQIRDVAPSFAIALTMGCVVYISGFLFNVSPGIKLLLQMILGVVIVVFISKITRFKLYFELKSIMLSRFNSVKVF